MDPYAIVDSTTGATSSAAASSFLAYLGIIWIVAVVVALIGFISMWIIFTKAGRPGWAAIIPIYNVLVELEVAGKPDWWIILFFVPFVNIIIAFVILAALAEKFGKSAGWGIFLLGIFPIGFPILAFGSAKYVPGETASVPAQPAVPQPEKPAEAAPAPEKPAEVPAPAPAPAPEKTAEAPAASPAPAAEKPAEAAPAKEEADDTKQAEPDKTDAAK